MSASKLLLYRRPANLAQIRIASGVALALFVLFASALFFRTQLFQNQQLQEREVFVAISSVILVMADCIIATLLFAQARVLQARPLYVLAAGFFLAGLLMALRIMSLPGAMGPLARRYDPTYNLPLWFYLSSHSALPVAILIYARLSRATDRSAQTQASGYRPPGRYLTGSMILAASVILGLTVVETSLPLTSPIFLAASMVILLVIAGMTALACGTYPELDLWMLLMLWGWLLELALIALPAAGYTAGWYAARTLGLLSGQFVLYTLLGETSKLYARTVLQLIAQTQEREHRFLIRDVMSASIAHELRQPLAAILLNAEVARKFASEFQGALAAPSDKILEIMDDIIASSHQANDILESTRAMFGRGDRDRERVSVDPAAILQSSLAMVESSARAQGVSVKFVTEGRPALVVINRLHFQQALLNLFQNALEALSQSAEPRRVLQVSCSCWDDRGVIIRVEDNGPGIAPADRSRIFDAFFTTRPGGLGMGLVIARSVIRSHGGRLEVEARSPTGTVFTIHLPATCVFVPGRVKAWA